VSFVSYVRKTNRAGRNRTRLDEISGEVQAAELDADPIASTARRGFGGEPGALLDHGPPLIEGMAAALANSPPRRQRAFTRSAGVSGAVCPGLIG
jgi:hypothetical protein